MRKYMVTAKLGHVRKNYYYKGTLFIRAASKKEAAQIARECPRVKHDQKDAILSVDEVSDFMYEVGTRLNKDLHYFHCENVQEQRAYLSEIENNIYMEEWITAEPKKYTKKHSLRNVYNDDMLYNNYLQNKNAMDLESIA